ncbi:unnamed protein product [Rhizoctonia solani]|uniref:Uncharacterized protein n=1 Tax=Rhizoctonia solani TaxID=456999 RepID=A0A8H2XM49_9AGAM|nr:unnamed protein product [Rhizoctonia solani]
MAEPNSPISPERKSQMVQSPTSPLGGFDLGVSLHFVPQRMSQSQNLPDWTFHPLPCTSQKSQPSAPSMRSASKPLPGRNSSFGHGSSRQGYFHHAKYRITTNIDMGIHDEIRNAIVTRAQEFSTDEFIELIVTHIDNSGSREHKQEYKLYYADHFNRTLGSETDDGFEPGVKYGASSVYSRGYFEWVKQIMQSPRNHFVLPSASPKEYSCLGRKIAQQVVWDHQNGVTDKQCQNIIDTVLKRFLIATPFKQPTLKPTFSAGNAEGEHGRITTVCVLIAFFIWHGPMLSIPNSYFRRLRTLASRADQGEFLPHLWRTLIKGLVKEWSMLNIVHMLIFLACLDSCASTVLLAAMGLYSCLGSANIAFLALPGTSKSPSDSDYEPSVLADVSRGAGLVSMFTTLGGLLTGLSLIWLHQPLQGTGSLDACRYILGPSYKQSQDPEAQSSERGSFKFLRLAWMATYLGMPLVLLSWSVIAFTISAVTWIFLFSRLATQVAVVMICGLVLVSPLITLIVFWRPIVAKDSLFLKMVRGDPNGWDV